MDSKKKKSFTERVQKVVTFIPKGGVLSYREVAKKAGAPQACRAVGSIMAKNRDPSIPCHRVIRADGVIGNYNRGGPEKKKQLLEKEGIKIKKINTIYKVIQRKDRHNM